VSRRVGVPHGGCDQFARPDGADDHDHHRRLDVSHWRRGQVADHHRDDPPDADGLRLGVPLTVALGVPRRSRHVDRDVVATLGDSGALGALCHRCGRVEPAHSAEPVGLPLSRNLPVVDDLRTGQVFGP